MTELRAEADHQPLSEIHGEAAQTGGSAPGLSSLERINTAAHTMIAAVDRAVPGRGRDLFKHLMDFISALGLASCQDVLRDLALL